MKNFIVSALSFLCIALLPSFAHAEAYGSGWYRELQVGLGYEDNISRSYRTTDQVSDETVRVSIGGGHSQKVGDNAQLVFYGYVALAKHNEYESLDNIAVSLGGNYTWQPNPGLDRPWYQIDASATNIQYDNSDGREGVLFQGDLNVNKRIGPRSTWHLGYRYNDLVFLGKTKAEEERDAAFDTATHEIYLGWDVELRRSVYLYGEYAFQQGGAWSNLSFSAGLVQYDAETIDPVFDDCGANPRCQPRYSGRIETDTHIVNLGVVFPIGTANIDVSAAYYDSEGDNGREYKDWYASVGLIWNF